MSEQDMMDWYPGGGHVRLEHIHVNGMHLKTGDRVQLRPGGRADAFDLLLAGRTAVIESIEQDYENRFLLAVVLDDDPGPDFGLDHKPAHRFFFSPSEVELLESDGSR